MQPTTTHGHPERTKPIARVLCSIACAAVVVCAPRADARAEGLDKIDQVRLISDIDIGSGTDTCKVDKNELTTSAKFILNAANIPFLDGYPNVGSGPEPAGKPMHDWYMYIPLLEVSVVTLATSGECIFEIKIELDDHAGPTTRLVYTDQHFTGIVKLWSADYIGIAPASDLSKQLADTVEQSLKQFVNYRAEDMRSAAKEAAWEAAHGVQGSGQSGQPPVFDPTQPYTVIPFPPPGYTLVPAQPSN